MTDLLGQADLSGDDLNEVNGNTCTLCMDDFQDSDEPVIRWTGQHPDQQPCGHPFHRGCIHTHVQTSSLCPSCRSAIANTGEDDYVRVHIERPAPVTTWPPMPPAALGMLAAGRVTGITQWIVTANLWNEGGQGGASPLFGVLVNHALRRAGVALPTHGRDHSRRGSHEIHLSHGWGGPVAEEAWRRVCDAAGRSDGWLETCVVSCAAVAHYIDVNGLRQLRSQLAGREDWQPIQGSAERGAHLPHNEAMHDDGYVCRRGQELLLRGPAGDGGDATQHAALLVGQVHSA